MAYLELHRLKKSFGGQAVVRDLTLSVDRGRLVSLLGPSGCGKSTTLRMIAGFESPDEGRVIIDGEDVTFVPANKRATGMVFQSYALFPNMTARNNISYGLRIRRWPKAKIRERVNELLSLVGLERVADHYPHQLSGGEQQRVALARALAPSPRLLLLDEPLSALDAKIRQSLRDEIRRLQAQLSITTVYVTHDQEEALSMSDEVVVMSRGTIEQRGTPLEIYNRPATPFVASFIGTFSRLRATMVDSDRGVAAVSDQMLELPSAVGAAENGCEIDVLIRPERITLIGAPEQIQDFGRAQAVNRLAGVVAGIALAGEIIRVSLIVGGNLVFADVFNDPARVLPEVGSHQWIEFPGDCALVFGPRRECGA